MNLIGIDIGSDSVRVSFRDSKTGHGDDFERPLKRITDGNKHTMSGRALWATILQILVEYNSGFAELFSGDQGGPLDFHLYNRETAEIPSIPELSAGVSLENKTRAETKISTSMGTYSNIPRSAVCVAATCSMVVMQKIEKNNRGPTGKACYFVPVVPGHEVIVWMDTRARAEAPYVALRLSEEVLAQIGGTVTPEMGIAKLKWVDTYLQKPDPNVEIYVFELYDWISYVLLAGGYCTDGLVRCLENLGNGPQDFAPGLRAMDGSVKGWGSDILQDLQISAHVGITPNHFDPQNIDIFPYVGTPLGNIGPVTVGHGCIDCYAGWVGQVACGVTSFGNGPEKIRPGELSADTFHNIPVSNANSPSERVPNITGAGGENPTVSVSDNTRADENCPENGTSLLMVAGTSTCFIASVAPDFTHPIPGLWGPFNQLLPSPVYSFGQPATGQLFAELFAQYDDLIGIELPFAFVEKHAHDLELKTGYSLPVLCRHYLYYGDKHGNRSPYGDFRMGEVVVDGVNAATKDTFPGIFTEDGTNNNDNNNHDNKVRRLVLQYYLTLEFLAFQTKQLGCKLCLSTGPVNDVYMAGSQAQNTRLVELLANLVFPGSRIHIQHGAESKYAGSHGIALAMLPYIKEESGLHTVFKSTWLHVLVVPLDSRAIRVLLAKFHAFEELALWQHRFHKSMAGL